MIYLFYIIGIIIVVRLLYNFIFNVSERIFDKDYKCYVFKKFMTNYEKYFYNILVELEKEYFVRIQPQINLATIVNINSGNKNILELFKNACTTKTC